MDLRSGNYKMGMMIIITGASKGIGKYLFDEFKNRGHEVIGTYNTTSCDPKEGYFQVDVSDERQVKDFVCSLDLQAKKIVLVNCAGISYNSFIHKADPIQWQKVIEVNLMGTFYMVHALLPIMRSNGYGRIINFASVVTKVPTPGVSAYAVSKSGINALTKSISVENASKGITVNSLNLGYTNLGMGLYDVPEAYKKMIMERIPLHRFCSPSEIFNMVSCMIETEYLTGSIIDIDGGLF